MTEPEPTPEPAQTARFDGIDDREDHQPADTGTAAIAGRTGEAATGEPPRAAQHESGPDQPPSTGVPAVDTALRPLSGIDQAPVHAHVERFEAAHAALQQALAQMPGGSDPDGA